MCERCKKLEEELELLRQFKEAVKPLVLATLKANQKIHAALQEVRENRYPVAILLDKISDFEESL